MNKTCWRLSQTVRSMLSKIIQWFLYLDCVRLHHLLYSQYWKLLFIFHKKRPRFNGFCHARFICWLLDRLHFSRLPVLTTKWQDWCVFIGMMCFQATVVLSQYLTMKSEVWYCAKYSVSLSCICHIKWDALRNLVPYGQIEKTWKTLMNEYKFQA